MELFLLVGLFCVLLTIGFMFTEDAWAFAFKSMIGLFALSFIVILGSALL